MCYPLPIPQAWIVELISAFRQWQRRSINTRILFSSEHIHLFKIEIVGPDILICLGGDTHWGLLRLLHVADLAHTDRNSAKLSQSQALFSFHVRVRQSGTFFVAQSSSIHEKDISSSDLQAIYRRVPHWPAGNHLRSSKDQYRL